MTAIRVRNRDDLLTVMRKAREDRGFTHLEMDERVGLGSGHYGKIERMGAGWGKQAVRISPSVVNCLDLLGLELVIAPKGAVAADTVPRDVRLPPVTVEMPVSVATGPSMLAQWRERRRQQAQAAAEKAASRRKKRA
jgi:hypothetical protein